MKASNKNRRSERIPARHNMMMILEEPGSEAVMKEVVTTVQISQHGAHLLGRRPLVVNAKGNVMNLSSCRKAPFRIAWQVPSDSHPGYHETGIEFVEPVDFWGCSFSEYRPGTASAVDTPRTPSGAYRKSDVATPHHLLEQLRLAGDSPKGYELTEALWCGLIEQLEERRIFTRTELISALKKLGAQA